MKQFLFKLANTILSLLLLVYIYAVKQNLHVETVIQKIGCPTEKFPDIHPVYSYIIYFVFLVILAYFLSRRFSSLKILQEIPSGTIELIEPVGDTFITSYLGYFFIALSIPDLNTLIISFMVLGLFVFLSNIYLFNPLYLLLGYKFFYATTKQKKKILIITREDIQFGDEVSFSKLRKVNEFTFIDA